MIPLHQASEQLGVTVPCLVRDCDKYRPFYIKTEPGKYNAQFDIEGFRRAEALKEELLEKTKLLTEYLYYEEGMRYTEIARAAGLSTPQVQRCGYGYEAALKIARVIRDQYYESFKRFHEYYEWRLDDK